ncbi:23479_t:CDS:2 [Cetraspora pellucida]|uniref:23479_t:CDS:1 n=1 Tax=Cetraspora pellucida TaxID=1433469 RepID=A0A9N9A2T5_9GLOM|nr:23479_t:CDS:2 [Cetraspora pellucida]
MSSLSSSSQTQRYNLRKRKRVDLSSSSQAQTYNFRKREYVGYNCGRNVLYIVYNYFIMAQMASENLIFSSFLPLTKESSFQLAKRISNGLRPEIPKNPPQCYKDQMNQCWDHNPE